VTVTSDSGFTLTPYERASFLRDLLAQLHHPFHRCVLVEAFTHRRGRELGEPRIDVVVGKALTEIEGAELAARGAKHHREDGGPTSGSFSGTAWKAPA